MKTLSAVITEQIKHTYKHLTGAAAGALALQNSWWSLTFLSHNNFLVCGVRRLIMPCAKANGNFYVRSANGRHYPGFLTVAVEIRGTEYLRCCPLCNKRTTARLMRSEAQSSSMGAYKRCVHRWLAAVRLGQMRQGHYNRLPDPKRRLLSR